LISQTIDSIDESFSPPDFRKHLSKAARQPLPTEQIAWKSDMKEESRNIIAVLFLKVGDWVLKR